MKLQETDRGQLREGGAGEIGADGARPRTALKRSGSVLLKLAALALLVAAGAWALYANLKSDRPAMDMSMRVTSGNTPFPVSIAPVERRSVVGNVVYTGSVAPFNEEDVYPRVTGRIVEMLVYPGDAVRPGQVVARLDSVELSSRVGEAEAGLASAQASRAQMEADLGAARYAIAQMEKEVAMVDAELTYSRSLIARTERLFNTGAVSRQEYESDRAMAASTEAKREAAQAKLEQARAGEAAARKKLEAADSMVAQARASLRTATIVRDYVEIVTPSSGYVVKRLVAPGVLVQPGMAILKIAQIDRVRLQANVGEKDVASIRVGSPVTVTTAVAGQPPITARVTAVFPFVDQGPRTAVVEALVENAGRRFLPGQYVTMQFVTGERSDAATVPVQALTRMGGKATVWIVKDGRAEPRTVVTGLEGPERVEITQGLSGREERVIVRGHESLYAGARVSDVSGTATASPDKRDSPTTMPDMPGMPGMKAGEPPAQPTPPARPKMEGPHGSHEIGFATRLACHTVSVAAGLAMLATAVAAQPLPRVDRALTMEQAVDLAREANLRVKAADADARAMDSMRREALAPFWPQLSANGYYNDQRMAPNVFTSAGNTMARNYQVFNADQTKNGNFTAMYPLFSGGRDYYGYQAAARRAEAGREMRRGAELDVAMQARLDYIAALREAENLRVTGDLLRDVEERLRITREQYEAGRVPRYYQLRDETERANAIQMDAMARSRAEQALIALKTTLGVDLASSITLADQLQYTPAAVSVEEGTRQAGETHPDLQSATKQREAAQAEVRAAYGNYFPQVSVSYMYDGQWSKNRNEASTTADGYSVGVVVTLPLFDGFQRENALKTAKAKLDRATQGEGLVRQQIAKDVNQTALMLTAADKSVEASRQGVEQAAEEFRVVKERFESGRGIQLEILDAQVSLTRARFNAVAALSEYNSALAMWLRATGRVR